MTNGVVSFKPLYMQVKESLIRRLIDRSWSPGQLIPSEMVLARELNVSQGTVRKALDAMTAENLLVRKQGRGTYVAEHQDNQILFNFFRLAPDSGERVFPDSHIIRQASGKATRMEAEILGLAEDDAVWRLERVRTFYGSPLLVEVIALPAARLPGFGKLEVIPNNIYRLYSQKWGITIATAQEKLKATSANTNDAHHLGCSVGTPLLEILRVAYDLERRVVEMRTSRCLTEKTHYLSELG